MQKTQLILILLLLPIFTTAQTLSGYLEDSETGEGLIGATILETTQNIGTTTNAYGFFSLTLPKQDSVKIRLSYIGYQPIEETLLLEKDKIYTFRLIQGTALETIEVSSKKQGAKPTQMGKVGLSIEQIKALPSLLGETDPLKAFQLLPGVQGGMEGTSGLYVRGGTPDQNLILLDGVPVYNASHLFGFFSVFNADALHQVTLMKGDMPARYGGRLSSVMDITMKEGNQQDFKAEGAIGLIFSKLTVEGPIQKGKTSFMVSGRRTYWDKLVEPILHEALKSEGIDSDLDVYFYDVNAKINHKFDEKNRLYLSYYTGRDVFGVNFSSEDSVAIQDTNTKLQWGNTILTARYNRLWNAKLFSNTTLIYSRFDLETGYGFTQTDKIDQLKATSGYVYNSGIEDLGVKVDFDYLPQPKHHIRFGIDATRHKFTPDAKQIIQSSVELDSFSNLSILEADELNLYAEDEWTITNKLSINAGVRLAAFYTENTWYSSLQPRLSSRYQLTEQTSIQASAGTAMQFIHLLANEGIGLPTDLWVPSTASIRPQTGWHTALGINTIWKNYEIGIEGYYRKMNNVVSYKAGAAFALGDISETANWQEKITQGEGTSYGVEFLLKKPTGKLTGWFAYTLAKTDRFFTDLNQSQPYPFTYDRRHDISVVANYPIKERLKLSVVWVYGTGSAVTIPDVHLQLPGPVYVFNDGNTNITTKKNNYRTRTYHRLDINLDFEKDKKWGKQVWSIGTYNTYHRKNTFYVGENLFGHYGSGLTQETPLFPIVPYVSYKFKIQ